MILSAIKDRSEWLNIISKFPIEFQDIYFHPDYISLNCYKNNSEGFLFYNKDKEKIWINAFIKIKSPSFDNFNNHDYYDIETAYGYGGPISNKLDINFIKDSNKKFLSWVNANNIVSEFVRFHPLFDITFYASSEFEILDNRTTCSLDLSKVDSENILPFKAKAKNKIRKALKSTEAFISHDIQDFIYFKKLYLNLMINKDAEKETLFSALYFDKLFNLILENGFMSVIKNKNLETIAIAIFLNGKQSCHYHLSASKHYDIPGVNNLIIYNAALHAKKKKLHILHLGGGNNNDKDDKLFKFKNSMSTSNHKYYIGKRINNLEIYKKLKSSWKKKYPILYNKYSSRLLCYHLNTEIVDTNY